MKTSTPPALGGHRNGLVSLRNSRDLAPFRDACRVPRRLLTPRDLGGGDLPHVCAPCPGGPAGAPRCPLLGARAGPP